MDRQKTEGFGPVDLFELSGKLLPTLPWFPRTEKLAEQVADLIVGNRFLVKYDKTTAPVIDAAIMRNPLLDQEQGEAMLYSLWEDEYILLYDAENHPPMLAGLQDDETGYAEFLTYEDCVAYAEAELKPDTPTGSTRPSSSASARTWSARWMTVRKTIWVIGTM